MPLVKIDEDAAAEDPQVWDNIRALAGEIAKDANQTSAKIGITVRPEGSGVPKSGAIRITSRGAPAVAVEVGTSRAPARRPVKQALDRRRIR